MERLALQGTFSPRSASGRRWRADYQVLSATEAIVLSYLFSFLHGPKRRRRVQTITQSWNNRRPPSAVANQRLLAPDLAEPFAEPDAPRAAAPNQRQTDGGKSSNGEGTSRWYAR